MRFFTHIALAGMAVALGVSCQTTTQLNDLEADAATITPFLEDFENIKEMNGRGPFQRVWAAAPDEHLKISSTRDELFIAPVETVYLQRPADKEEADRPIDDVAARLRNEFVRAFMESESPRYVVVDEQSSDSVVLRLSIVELEPTRGATNGKVGSMAIEGQLREPSHNYLLLQFADRELDADAAKTSRRGEAWEHAGNAAHIWANQFEAVTRNPKWREEVLD